MRLRACPTLRNIGLCLALFCVAACKSDNPTHVSGPAHVAALYERYETQVLAIRKSIAHDAQLEGLWRRPEFDALASQAAQQIDDCLKFVADPKHENFEKYLAIWAMYKLPLPDYLIFVRRLVDLHNVDRDGESRTLTEALVPRLSFFPANPIFANRKRPEVRSLLNEIAAQKQADKFALDWLISYDDSADFAAHVIDVNRDSEHAITEKGLWTGYAFDVLAVEAPAHVDNCIAFLADPTHTWLQKEIAIYAMYKLPLPDYIAFIRKLLDLYDRGLIAKSLLMRSISAPPHVLPRDMIFDHYDDPAVQALLRDVETRPGWDKDEKWYLDWVKNGGDFYYKLHAFLDYVHL